MAFVTETGKTYRVTGTDIDAWLDYTPPGNDPHDPGQSNNSAGFSLSGLLITVVEQCHRIEEGHPRTASQFVPYEVVKVTVDGRQGQYYAWVVYEGVVKVEAYTPPAEPSGPEQPPTEPSPPQTQPTEPSPPQPTEPQQPQPPEPPTSQPGDVQIEVHAGQTVVVEVKSTTTKTTDLPAAPPDEWVFQAVDHMFQEYHINGGGQKPPYGKPPSEDSKVVEKWDDQKRLKPKKTLHLCFLEAAIATFKANVPSNEGYYAKWEIINQSGEVAYEHPSFSSTNYEKMPPSPAAKLANGALYGWKWDGRNNAEQRVFCAEGTYRSRLTVKNDSGMVKEFFADITLEGNPYHVVVVGQPKSDKELEEQLSQQYLYGAGERTARDCWIKVYRGIKNDEIKNDDRVDNHAGHLVFLGHGAQEATSNGNTSIFGKFIEGKVTEAEYYREGGAIATPHDRWLKGWLRRDGWPRLDSANLARPEFESIGNSDGLIKLNVNDPVAKNPYCDTQRGGPYKDFVQAHPGSLNGWTHETMSVGCTTVSSATEFGNSDGVEVIAFANKQSSGDAGNAGKADDHSSPLDNLLHIQRTFQEAVFGGFATNEIPASPAVADDPQGQARIRLMLRPYAIESRYYGYYVYHHAVVFGHDYEKQGGIYNFKAWIPRKVIRGWNGNFRNLLVRGRCMINWCIERRPDADTPVVVHNLLQPNSLSQDYETLPSDIPLTRNWTPTVPLAPGTYVSILRYRISVLPSGQEHDWVGAPNMKDLFSKNSANLHAESNDGAFLYGSSELYIPII